jgi:hypothetical protein
MRTELTGDRLPIQRRLVLELLRRLGSLPVDQIPPLPPLRDEDVAGLVQELAQEGALALGWDRAVPGRRTARLTAGGLGLLRAEDAGAPAEPGRRAATVRAIGR